MFQAALLSSKSNQTEPRLMSTQPTASGLTLMVSSMDRNFLLSPINMALLINGTASFTASSMGTGGMFSPPAVMISSKEQMAGTHKVTDSKGGSDAEEEREQDL